MSRVQEAFPWSEFIRECVGGAVGLGVVYLLLKFKPWRNGSNGKELRAGDRSVEFWLAAHRAATEDAVNDGLKDYTELIRTMIRDEVALSLGSLEFQRILVRGLRYFYGLGKEPKNWIDE